MAPAAGRERPHDPHLHLASAPTAQKGKDTPLVRAGREAGCGLRGLTLRWHASPERRSASTTTSSAGSISEASSDTCANRRHHAGPRSLCGDASGGRGGAISISWSASDAPALLGEYQKVSAHRTNGRARVGRRDWNLLGRGRSREERDTRPGSPVRRQGVAADVGSLQAGECCVGRAATHEKCR